MTPGPEEVTETKEERRGEKDRQRKGGRKIEGIERKKQETGKA